MKKTLTWKDKSNNRLVITYSGNKTDNVIFQTQPNEGLDRMLPITFVTKNGYSIQKNVIQEGRREIFNAADGSFILADCDTFNVIKQGYEQ